MLDEVLKLHPSRAELWIYAAQVAMDDAGSMFEARTYLQRGLRFCGMKERKMWLEYARFECLFIGKIVGRREVLGINGKGRDIEEEEEEDDSGTMDFEQHDEISLPTVSIDELNPESSSSIDPALQRTLSSDGDNSSVLSGSIPIIIFTQALTTIPDPGFAASFFDVFASKAFSKLPCQKRLVSHVDEYLTTNYPTDARGIVCHIRESLVGVDVTDALYPGGLRTAFKRLIEGREVVEGGKNGRGVLYDGFVGLLLGVLDTKKKDEKIVDESLLKAARIMLERVVGWSREDGVVLAEKARVERCRVV